MMHHLVSEESQKRCASGGVRRVFDHRLGLIAVPGVMLLPKESHDVVMGVRRVADGVYQRMIRSVPLANGMNVGSMR